MAAAQAHVEALAAAAEALQSPALFQGQGKCVTDLTDSDGSPLWPAVSWLQGQSQAALDPAAAG